MMLPPPCFRIWIMAYFEQRNADFRVVSITKSHSSSEVSGTGLDTCTPTLFTRTSSRP